MPAFLFSVLSVREIKKDGNKQHIFPILFGIIGILIGFILHKAIDWWSLIVLFNMILIISSFICKGGKLKTLSSNYDSKNIGKEHSFNINNFQQNSTYRIAIVSQLIGLASLFILTVSFVLIPPHSNSNYNPKQQIIGFCISGFLFLLNCITTFSFSRKKKWAFNLEYIESYILLGFSILLLFSFIITEGILLTKTFFSILLFFTLLISFFIYLIHNYEKLKKTGIFLAFFILLFVSFDSALANNTKEMQKIYLLDKNNFNSYVEYSSGDITNFNNPEKLGKYPPPNLFDGSLETCWVSGKINGKNHGILYIKIPNEIPLDKLILNIFSGYGKSKSLYYANARPKRIGISIYSAYNPKGYVSEIATKYFIKKYSVEKEIILNDTFGVQSFPLNLNKKKLMDFQNETLKGSKLKFKIANIGIKSAFILKLEITDIYKGNRYDDICISEIFFNNRFVTSNLGKNNRIENVYIKNGNILTADFAGNGIVTVYKDTSSVFTTVDWEKYSNWAILHSVKNDAVGKNSRIEESYLLVDLKNMKIVNSEFKRYTGIPICSPFIEKDKNGRYLLNIFDKYNVELK